MNTYRAKFSVPAEVTIEFEVTAENQQDGLVLAHDLVRQATLDQAKIVGLTLACATNIEFVGIARSLPVAALPVPDVPRLGTSLLVFFEGRDYTGQILSATRVTDLSAAKLAIAAAMADLFGKVCSASVVDEFGQLLLGENAPRGGWEVELCERGPDNAADVTFRTSWVESSSMALTIAMTLLGDVTPARILRVLDYTDRSRGPVVWRTFE